MRRKIDRLEPFQRAISKAYLASAGISIDSLEDTDKPFIAIANSWNKVCPGHEPLRQLAQEVKKDILEVGGEPIEFNTIATCDGIAQGHSGMRYCLPHRDLITDSCEAMIVGGAYSTESYTWGHAIRLFRGCLMQRCASISLLR